MICKYANGASFDEQVSLFDCWPLWRINIVVVVCFCFFVVFSCFLCFVFYFFNLSFRDFL